MLTLLAYGISNIPIFMTVSTLGQVTLLPTATAPFIGKQIAG
jgi:hypothetical protein